MNIIYYLRAFPKLSESFILNEIYSLEKKGHNVAVFSLGNPDDTISHTELDDLNVPIRYGGPLSYRDLSNLLTADILRRDLWNDLYFKGSVQESLADIVRTKQCIDFVEQLPWDIHHIHSHFATKDTFPGVYLASCYDVPFTLTTHAYDIYRDIGTYTGPLLRMSDRIVTISEYNRQYISEQFVEDTPIDVVHAGIRPEKFDPTTESKRNRILTVSRLTEKKGLQYGLKAVANVVEVFPDIEYHIVGSGPLYDELTNCAETLGIEKNVTFLNNITDEQLLSEYNRARCFLLPCVVTQTGERDGIPVVLMEAMAMNTPPVSTRVSGIPELIDHGKHGLLTAPRDPEALSRALVQLLENDPEWREYCKQGRKKIVEEFDIEKETDKLTTTFETARDSKLSPPSGE